ncbi:uncharacterized protein [Triticum aestivum]|uniref:uncharacterized protein n=1 Tax=Triticum aestivum TaxID=4565 RepID=UPI001D02D310|nr:uncharacterized protein LOC123100297 [Triticum aestivum]
MLALMPAVEAAELGPTGGSLGGVTAVARNGRRRSPSSLCEERRSSCTASAAPAVIPIVAVARGAPFGSGGDPLGRRARGVSFGSGGDLTSDSHGGVAGARGAARDGRLHRGFRPGAPSPPFLPRTSMTRRVCRGFMHRQLTAVNGPVPSTGGADSARVGGVLEEELLLGHDLERLAASSSDSHTVERTEVAAAPVVYITGGGGRGAWLGPVDGRQRARRAARGRLHETRVRAQGRRAARGSGA